MASALFASRAGDHADPVEVSSAGTLARGDGMPTSVPEPVLEVMGTYGIDLRGHESRALTAAMLEETDLVIGMSRRHVQEAILLEPNCWPSAFMLKELVRRGEQVGPRDPEIQELPLGTRLPSITAELELTGTVVTKPNWDWLSDAQDPWPT